MRPKKRVLLYCLDELRGSRVAFVLHVRGFQVVQADRLVALAHELDWARAPFDGALVLDAGEASRGEDAVSAIQGHGLGTRVMLQPATLRTSVTLAERVLPPGCPMDELVEAVRVLCSVKRGPKARRPLLPIGAQRALAAAGTAAVS